jgi:pimeloyl-ACP methyl ester carboxylesterase
MVAGDPDGPTVVLLHGFPQTSFEWRHVIPGLAEAGYRAIAPDLRGMGNSWRPDWGYDKVTLAGDVRKLLDRIGVNQPVSMIGHDIGLMVGYAYAQAHRSDVSHLAIIDALLPGTHAFDLMRSDPRLWHFNFHGVRDLAETLVAGNESEYLQYFFDRTSDRSAISREEFEIYLSAYSAPGAMSAGFELYRTFDHDANDNRLMLARNGKLSIPVLAIGGATSISGPLVEGMMMEVADDVRGVRIPGTAHWIPEEAPTALVDALVEFLAR